MRLINFCQNMLQLFVVLRVLQAFLEIRVTLITSALPWSTGATNKEAKFTLSLSLAKSHKQFSSQTQSFKLILNLTKRPVCKGMRGGG